MQQSEYIQSTIWHRHGGPPGQLERFMAECEAVGMGISTSKSKSMVLSWKSMARSRDYLSALSWEWLWAPMEELEEVAGDRIGWAPLLSIMK